MNEPMITRWSLCSLQVCVPKSFTDAEAEEFANRENPTGIESPWLVTDRMDQRVQCEERPDCCHIVMDC
jgi:hypothetical protein